MIAAYEHPKGRPHAKEIDAEQLHQLAFRTNKRALSVGLYDLIQICVVVPHNQVERFHQMLEPAARNKVLIASKEGVRFP